MRLLTRRGRWAAAFLAAMVTGYCLTLGFFPGALLAFVVTLALLP